MHRKRLDLEEVEKLVDTFFIYETLVHSKSDLNK